MTEQLEKIRIENGKLIGLSNGGETLDIAAFAELFDVMGKGVAIEALSDTITGIGRALSYMVRFNLADKEPEIFAEIVALLPYEGDLHSLNMLLKALIK